VNDVADPREKDDAYTIRQGETFPANGGVGHVSGSSRESDSLR
jgi:hypothetical protein